MPDLTKRQRAVVELLSQGFLHKEIAERLRITTNRVSQIVCEAKTRLGCRTTAHLLKEWRCTLCHFNRN